MESLLLRGLLRRGGLLYCHWLGHLELGEWGGAVPSRLVGDCLKTIIHDVGHYMVEGLGASLGQFLATVEEAHEGPRLEVSIAHVEFAAFGDVAGDYLLKLVA